ncbi:MAG: gas vesicle protein [Burkholderiales bacterium]|nr:gas vesicle protein [Burkholderiales bacterium]
MAGKQIAHGTESATLADVLERILDKGLVIAGDIKIKLVDIELLTIQIRLLVCSVDKAREMGIDWWMTNSYLCSTAGEREDADQLARLNERIAKLEESAVPSNLRI